ncbi:hypothetical protein ACIA8O_35825 [Kitasatospora sp. NPDC051853]|uniref:hypothetical protein n=1 Tax=Kitasatospora sp. NPDC051853 TaxID=3364058 RepID=UPI0037AD51FB
MSIYATWLLFADDDGDAPAPLVYQGSHVSPAEHHPRAGRLELAAVPNHCHPQVRGRHLDAEELDELPSLPVEFLRLSLSRPAPGDSHDAGATVVLDRAQVEQLHRTLGAWLETGER